MFTWGKQTLSISSSSHTSVYVSVRWLRAGFRQRCLWQGREWGWAKKGLDTGAQPHPAPRLLPAPGEGSLGQRLCFPDSSYVCGSAARAGVPAIAGPSTPKDDKRLGNPRGGRQQRVIGAESGDTPRPDARALDPSSPAARPPHSRCARRRGGSPPLARPPALRAPTHLRRRRRRSAARGAGHHLPPARGGGSGRPGGGCRGGAHHLGRIAGSSGAAAGECEPVGRPGAASRAHRPARPPLSLHSCLLLPPGLRRSLPAGPVSGPSAEQPPPGAALRLLRRRRRRLRRRQLLPASRPPGRPRGTRGLSPARESRRAGGEETRGSILGSPDPG